MSDHVDISRLPAELQQHILEDYLDQDYVYTLEYNLQSLQAPALLRRANQLAQRHWYRDNAFHLPVFYSFLGFPGATPVADPTPGRSFDPTGAQGMKRLALETIDMITLTNPEYETMEADGQSAHSFMRVRIPDGSAYSRPAGDKRSDPPQFRLQDLQAFSNLKTIVVNAVDFDIVMRLVLNQLKRITRPITLRVNLCGWMQGLKPEQIKEAHKKLFSTNDPKTLEMFRQTFKLPDESRHRIEFVVYDAFVSTDPNMQGDLGLGLLKSFLEMAIMHERLRGVDWTRAGLYIGEYALRQKAKLEAELSGAAGSHSSSASSPP